MRDKYDIKNLNPRSNPYSKHLKKQITININVEVVDYFKNMAEQSGIPYQTLINLYLMDCAENKRELEMTLGDGGNVYGKDSFKNRRYDVWHV